MHEAIGTAAASNWQSMDSAPKGPAILLLCEVRLSGMASGLVAEIGYNHRGRWLCRGTLMVRDDELDPIAWAEIHGQDIYQPQPKEEL